jgi:chromosome segregation ATPase
MSQKQPQQHENNDYSFMLHSIEKKLTSSISAQVNDYYKKNPSSAKKLTEVSNKENKAVPSPKEKVGNFSTATIELPSQIGLHSPMNNLNAPFVDHSLSSIRMNPSVLKKRRISHDSNLHDELTFDYNPDDPTIHAPTLLVHQPTSQPFSKTITLQSQIDELTIVKDSQKDQIRLLKLELENYKDQTIKQLQFMETSNKKLAAEVEEKTNKYYEDKKKWQLKVKEIETKKMNEPVTTSSSTSSSSSANNNSQMQYISDLQKQLGSVNQMLKDKLSENEKLITDKVSCEKKLIIVENELKTLKLQMQFQPPVLSNDDKIVEEKLQLRKQISSLELKLQQKASEINKMKDSNKNQLLLEEEIQSLRNQILFYQERNQEMNEIENNYNQVLEDKKHWNQVLNKIMNLLQPASSNENSNSSFFTSAKPSPFAVKKNDENSNNNTSNISHTRVLSCIQALQEKYLLLLNEKNDMSSQVNGLKLTLESKDGELKDLQSVLSEKNDQIAKKEHSIQQFTSQLKSFDREIHSLRELLQTYDLEFSMSSKQQKAITEESIINLKNQAIVKLQSEIDELRKQYKELQDRVNESAGEREKKIVTGETASASVENSEWEQKYNELYQDYLALQEITGVDYLPHKTKVSSSSFLE